MSEQEYHPSAQFNPGHPDHAGWANGPKPPQLPAEAQIVRDFPDPETAPAAEAGIVTMHQEGAFADEHVALPGADEEEPETKPKTSRKH
ncbi:hypothetical protein [Amycolatopsis sp. Hca4]|uniref:hypothetical protein n=1 Tax=Amycolatopsis sp. Hca4 TaxID=2742131 RepID=UPI001592808E|nr:hypothetical protein [Amycolatopsis sp. Hca4]QKV74525.1 hypothetical protein HUT10_12665 [Amycolatopsis sp. Hca4]